MTPRGITMATILLFFTVGMLGPTPAASSRLGKACCTRYNRKPLPFGRIKGFREQTTHENCRIKAIIFYTINNLEVCVTQRDEWVKKTLFFLSSKLKKMSEKELKKTNSDEQEVTTIHENDDNRSFFNTTSSVLHNENFY